MLKKGEGCMATKRRTVRHSCLTHRQTRHPKRERVFCDMDGSRTGHTILIRLKVRMSQTIASWKKFMWNNSSAKSGQRLLAHNLYAGKHRSIREKFPYRLTIAFVSLMFFISACTTVSQPPVSQATPTRLSQAATPVLPTETPKPSPTSILPEELVEERIPEPTATPGVINRAVTTASENMGVDNLRFLGLFIADWINLGISALFILFAYFLAFWASKYLIIFIRKRTSSHFDNESVNKIGANLRFLVILPIIRFAINRLQFISVGVKTFFDDVIFVFAWYFAIVVIINLVEVGIEWVQENWVNEDRRQQFDPLVVLFNRFSRIVIITVGITLLLSNFGINVAVLTATLGIGGFAISLAAKDTIADAIAGIIILVDQPFRVGDRIEIQFLGTWGDVEDIGLRTTKIRTRDNRMVIIPNSSIGNNQIVNYTYPDPRYRVQTHVDIGYGTDVEMVRKLLVDTVSHVDGILEDKPVDALYFDMTGPAMRFRVRWWIESYMDARVILDRVHTAIQHALDEAGIDSPHFADNVNLIVEDETTQKLSKAFKPLGKKQDN